MNTLPDFVNDSTDSLKISSIVVNPLWYWNESVFIREGTQFVSNYEFALQALTV